jgi:hypothetical protein
MESFEPEFLICPSCHTKCGEDYFRVYQDILSGLVGGWVLRCPHCEKLNYINMLAKPPLFDLSRKIYGFGA